MHIRKLYKLIVLSLLLFNGCTEEDHYSTRKNYLRTGCEITEIVATSTKTACCVQFWDYMHLYTYISNESSFYKMGPICNESVIKIKYVNLKHDHNEPDYTFELNLGSIAKEDFFKKGSFPVSKLSISESKLTGGSGSVFRDVDITFVWEDVSLIAGIYSGTGKFIINKEIPTSYPGYVYPVQEIPFKFLGRDRSGH